MAEAAVSLTQAPKRTLRDKLFYGFGSVAYGVKDNGFGVLLLLFYNQVLGLPADLVANALLFVLIADSVVDPLLGHFSDNFRSRWGRRHPFMYAAVLPVSLSYLALWNPPSGMTQDQSLLYLFVVAIFVRTFITFFEVPSTALVADLSPDYQQRTSFLSYRFFFGWWGGLTMNILAFSVFLRPTAEYPSGQLNPNGYVLYGLAAAVIMACAMLASSLGTHRLIPSFRQPPPKRPTDLKRTARELRHTLSNGPFLIIAASGLLAFMAFGLGLNMVTYLRTYFWELTGDEISLLTLGNFGSAFVGLLLAPKLSAWLGKKRACLVVIFLQLVLNPSVYALRATDLLPGNDTASLLAILFVHSFVTTALVVISGILTASMIADAVEHGEIRTGRRSDGLYFAANSFAQKCLSGVGIFGAGQILKYADFPDRAIPGQVADAILFRLMIVEVSIIALLQLLAIVVLTAYPINQATHEANLRTLEDKVLKAREPGAAATPDGSLDAGISPASGGGLV